MIYTVSREPRLALNILMSDYYVMGVGDPLGLEPSFPHFVFIFTPLKSKTSCLNHLQTEPKQFPCVTGGHGLQPRLRMVH